MCVILNHINIHYTCVGLTRFNKHIQMLVNICSDKHFPIHRKAYGFVYTQIVTKDVRSQVNYMNANSGPNAAYAYVLNLQRSRNRLYNILLIIDFT